MATKRQLIDNPHSTLNRAGEDEPLIILRATDRTTVSHGLAWIREAFHTGVPQEKIDGFYALVREIMGWQRKHPELVHTPD